MEVEVNNEEQIHVKTIKIGDYNFRSSQGNARMKF